MTLYAATGGDTPGNLYTISRTTGATLSTIGPIGFCVAAMAFDPTNGDLYGATNTDDPTDPTSLISIDPVTGTGTLIGAFADGQAAYDLAFNATGDLFAVMRLGGDQTLVQIDPSDGSYVTVGLLGDDSYGYSGLLKFDALGGLYVILGTGVDGAWRMDAGTGALLPPSFAPLLYADATEVADIPGSALDSNGDWFVAGLVDFVTGATDLSTVAASGACVRIGSLPAFTEGLAWDGAVGTWFDPDALGNLYCARGGNVASSLFRLQETTYYPIEVGPTGKAWTGLAFDPTDGTLYGVTSNGSPSSTNRKLYTIDKTTGTATLMGALGVGSDTMTDISFAADGTLYGIRSSGGTLYTINKSTGAATIVGAAGPGGFGGGFELDGCEYDVASLATEQGAITTFDLATGDAAVVSAFSGADDNNPVNAISCDADGLMWAWGNTFDSTNDLFTFGLDGAVTLVAQVSIDPDAGQSWDALAWDTPKGCLTIPTPCANDAFEDAFDLVEGTPSCCTMWAATNTAENAAGWSPAFTAPVTWYVYQPAADHEALFTNGADAVTLKVYEGNPGDSLATLAAATPGNLVATSAPYPASNYWVSVNVLAAKTYYVAVTGYGNFSLAVYDGATYPVVHSDALGAAASSVWLAPAASHTWYGLSNTIVGADGDLRVAALDQYTSGPTQFADLLIYKFDGASWTLDDNLGTWTDASIPSIGTPGTGDWVVQGGITSGAGSLSLATDGTDVWCAIGVMEYEVWTDRPKIVTRRIKLEIYKLGTGLVHTELGQVYGAYVDPSSGDHLANTIPPCLISVLNGFGFTFYAGCGGGVNGITNPGRIQGVARSGVAYFGFAEAGLIAPGGVSIPDAGGAPYNGRIAVVGSDGSVVVPYENDPLGGADAVEWLWNGAGTDIFFTYAGSGSFGDWLRSGWRPDFDLAISNAGDVMLFMTDGDEPGSIATQGRGAVDSWDFKMVNMAGTVLQTFGTVSSLDKVLFPRSSKVEYSGEFWVGVTAGQGTSSGGAPCVFSRSGHGTVVLRVPVDGSTPFVQNNVPFTNYPGSIASLIPDEAAEAPSVWVPRVNGHFAAAGFAEESGGQISGMRAYAARLTACTPGTYVVAQSDIQTATMGATPGGQDGTQQGFLQPSAAVIDDTLITIAFAQGGTGNSGNIGAFPIAISRDGASCPRIVPVPVCVIPPPIESGFDMMFSFRVAA